jgi:hypothetical protein
MTNRHLIVCSPTYVPPIPSTLLDNGNCFDAIGGPCHTSLGDVSIENLVTLCELADNVEFVDDDSYQTETYLKTLSIINYISHRRPIKNFTAKAPLNFLDLDVSGHQESSLWVFGCSFSHGVGVTDSERYPSLLSKELNLPLESITRPGSSTRWSLRHLINANIKPNDLVVWQITTVSRISMASDKEHLEETLLKNASKQMVVALSDEQIYIDQLSLLQYGVNYLRSIGVKFCVISLDSNDHMEPHLILQYTRYPEYCYMGNWQIDVGSDNGHPGKHSHKLVADRLLKVL